MIMAMVLIGELGCVYWLIHVYEEMSANLSRLYSFDHLILSKTWLRKIPVGVRYKTKTVPFSVTCTTMSVSIISLFTSAIIGSMGVVTRCIDVTTACCRTLVDI